MSVKVTGIDGVINGLEGLVKGYNKESSKFLKSEGNKLKTRVKRTSKARIKKLTGNYEKGITVQKPYKYYKSQGGKAKDSVKVYGKYSKNKGGANHTHLIEDGHEKVLWGNRTAERVRAFYIYRDARNEYEAAFERNCETFINKVIGMF